jgi:predicted TIM-barrel fold metal-dependent hydrolase
MDGVSVKRTWLLVAAIAAAATALAVGITTAVERARPGLLLPALPLPALPVRRIDAHLRAEAGALDQAVQLSRSYGIDAFANLAGGWFGNGLETQLAAAGKHPGRIRVFMNLDVAGCCDAAWGAREAGRLAWGRGSRAAGLHLGAALAARAPLDGPALEPIWAACEKLSLPVSLWIGGAEERAQAERLAGRHPRLTLVLAHLGGPGAGLPELSRLLAAHPGLALDLSGRLAELGADPEAGRAFLRAHQDRVLFGTNLELAAADDGVLVRGAGSTPEQLREFLQGQVRFLESRDREIPLPGAGAVTGLGLPRDLLERIYHGNAERLLGFDAEGR